MPEHEQTRGQTPPGGGADGVGAGAQAGAPWSAAARLIGDHLGPGIAGERVRMWSFERGEARGMVYLYTAPGGRETVTIFDSARRGLDASRSFATATASDLLELARELDGLSPAPLPKPPARRRGPGPGVPPA